MGDIDFNDAEQQEQQVQEKRKFHVPVLRILMFLGIGLATLGLIVTVVVLTVRAMEDRGSGSSAALPVSEAYLDVPPIYEYFSGLGEIQTRTIDDPPASVAVNILIGYDRNNKAIADELNLRRVPLLDFLRHYFSSKRAEDLAPSNESLVKEEIKEQVNNMVRAKGVRDIRFQKLTVIKD